MKPKHFFFTSLIALVLVFQSCSEQEQLPQGEFARGVIVINEGNFSSANGSISFYNEDKQQVTQDIFAKVNGTAVGGLLQSVYFHDDRAFIIDNLGSRIHIVNASTFEYITTLEEGLSAPRYMVAMDGKAYISNWGQFDDNFNLPDSYVSIIDLSTYEETSFIATDQGSEGIFAYEGMVYVANSFSNTVEVIDPSTESVVSQIEVQWGPQSFLEDKNGSIWLLSSSFIGPSYLSTLDLNNDEVIKAISISDYAKSLNINGTGDQLFYLSAPFGEDSRVFSHDISLDVANTEPIITAENIYGLGVHPETDNLFLANHNGFIAYDINENTAIGSTI